MWLSELGFCDTGFNGPVPLSFKEIDAWVRLTQTDITPNEVLILSGMSKAYCSQYHSSGDINEPSPRVQEYTEQEIKDIQVQRRKARRMRVGNPSN